jgi:hypothetical protein
MRQKTGILLVGTVIVLLVAACDGPAGRVTPTGPVGSSVAVSPSPSASGSPTPSFVATVPANVPTTGPNLLSPGEKPPLPVPLVRTEAGARAFAEFFIKTIDWGYATTNSAYMRHYYQPSCDGCEVLADNIDSTHVAALHFDGGRLAIIRSASGTSAAISGSELSIMVHVAISGEQAIDSSGAVRTADPPDPTHREEIFLAWRGQTWTVVSMSGAN